MALGLLVGRFGSFIRENNDAPATDVPEADFPNELNHLREIVSHHLIPLTLLARVDGVFETQEHEVIVAHCVGHARRQGVEVGEDQLQSFAGYVSQFRPALFQLDPALSRLTRCPHDEVTTLIDAARAVVDADTVDRAEEMKFLDQMSEELSRMPHNTD